VDPDVHAGKTPMFTIYSRPGCHLCDEMKEVVTKVARRVSAHVVEVDISTDSDLESRYRLEIPVLMIDGRKAAKYRISEEDLLRIIRGRSEGPSTPSS
jgi:hypothetical protein